MTSSVGARVTQQMASAALIMTIGATGTMLSSSASACTFENFNDFTLAFQNQSGVRQQHIHKPLMSQQVQLQGSEPDTKTNEIDHPNAAVEQIFALQKRDELNVSSSAPDRMTLRDNKGKTLFILLFDAGNCWKLKKIENWSLGKEQALADAAESAHAATQRGDIYNRLANETPSDSSIALYASALDSYLYAAKLGSTKAAYLAAGISLSGQAPRLDNQQIQSLLETASQSYPDAGLTLANFYCDEGEYGESRPCANPEKSLEALRRSARLGSPVALIELGSTYASGSITERNPQRALACYEEAQRKGADGLQPSIDDLKTSGVETSNTVHCF